MKPKRKVKVWAKDRKTVLAEVSQQCQSVGAAKAAGVERCRRERVDRATWNFDWIEC